MNLVVIGYGLIEYLNTNFDKMKFQLLFHYFGARF